MGGTEKQYEGSVEEPKSDGRGPACAFGRFCAGKIEDIAQRAKQI